MKTFTNGDVVLINVAHLQGVAATVTAAPPTEDGMYICRVNEHQFEGHIVAFVADDLVSVEEANKALKGVKEHVLELHPSQRL